MMKTPGVEVTIKESECSSLRGQRVRKLNYKKMLIAGRSNLKSRELWQREQHQARHSCKMMLLQIYNNTSQMLSRKQNVQECDTTDDDSSNAGGLIILSLRIFIPHPSHRMKIFGVAAVLFKVFAEVENKIINGSCCRIYIITPDSL